MKMSNTASLDEVLFRNSQDHFYDANNRAVKFLQDSHQEVLDFIEDFRDIDEEIFELNVNEDDWVKIYLTGNCYFFAKQLSKAFGNAQIWFNDSIGHAVTEIEGVLFDARGVVPYRWGEDFLEENPLLELNGNCWSHDWTRGYAGRQLYFPTLKEAVKTPVHEYIGHTDDEELEEWVLHMLTQFIYDYMTDDAEVITAAIANGWLEEWDEWDESSDFESGGI